MINIVFDMDGILFDTERLSMESWRQAALQMELGDIEEGIYGCIGLNRTDCRILMKRLYGEAFPYEQFIACNSALFQERVEREGLPVKKGTFAGALSAFYHQVSVGHVEAGLRTYDKYSGQSGICPVFSGCGGRRHGGAQQTLSRYLPAGLLHAEC